MCEDVCVWFCKLLCVYLSVFIPWLLTTWPYIGTIFCESCLPGTCCMRTRWQEGRQEVEDAKEKDNNQREKKFFNGKQLVLVKGWSNGYFHILIMRVCIDIVLMESNLQMLKCGNVKCVFSRLEVYLPYLPKRNACIQTHRNMYKNVHAELFVVVKIINNLNVNWQGSD